MHIVYRYCSADSEETKPWSVPGVLVTGTILGYISAFLKSKYIFYDGRGGVVACSFLALL